MKDQVHDFEQIYRTYFSKMKRFAKEYVISEDVAENLVQDVFMGLWEKREVFMNRSNLIAFLFTSVKNKAINFLRRRMIEQNVTNQLQEEYIITMHMNLNSLEVLNNELFSTMDIEDIVSQAINSLPEKCREIFILSKIEGKKQKDVAEILNISVNTVETQIGIAYKKLKDKLKNVITIYLFLTIILLL